MGTASRFTLWAGGLIASLGIALGGCSPSAEIPITGRVTLELTGVSDSNIYFNLANGSSQRISFEGESWMLRDTIPSTTSYSITCFSNNEATTELPHFVDGWAPFWSSGPPVAKVAPGHQLRLAISKERFERFKGNHCRVGLNLENGSEVESKEFVP
jgi:hypothetical protein